MTLLDLLLLRGGFAPSQLGLPDDVLDADAPAGIPCRHVYLGHKPEAHPRARAGRPPGLRVRPAVDPAPLWPLTKRQADAQRQSERDLVRGAEREAAGKRGDA